MTLTDEIRAKAAWVAEQATHVRIHEDAITDYARELPAVSPPAPDLNGEADDELRAAFSLQLNAINFGSGWFPTLNKPPGLSGFRTVENGLRGHGPWTIEALKHVTREEIAQALGQAADHPLMALFERSLRELGQRVGDSFCVFARSGTAEELATELSTWPTWYDISPYKGKAIPLYKRAQIAAADLALQGLADGRDLHRLTLFADNLVPHVLRLDGILGFDDDLVARIDAEQLIEHDSPEEVEIRACALHAVELLVAAHGSTTATAVDNALWNRGAGARYKARPRHRARTTAY
ncbi:hypothetical protein DVA67_003360 [Solirubrobacter sp. CPCC 204708]|uniref:Queuosine 5'-phosphate N-glycosylase/hydrolase n=1 Tax=Solirubrobacter deserti TaxID=2282478 RepID=A0ABT4RMW3_9ACTN|nr:queuosine salvage family protein [Solirubrobacter deserti]MBE2314997.1 hypothetical protein [Solirubrobacter deserti]MDA0139912.1 queuosine salvage family protein [Solirubrobacter deserti]